MTGYGDIQMTFRRDEARRGGFSSISFRDQDMDLDAVTGGHSNAIDFF